MEVCVVESKIKTKQNKTIPPHKKKTNFAQLFFFPSLSTEGVAPNARPKRHLLQPNVTEVGNERSLGTIGQYLQLFGPTIEPRHCVIAHTGERRWKMAFIPGSCW